METITDQLAAILAGISADRRPEMAEHFNRLDELKAALMEKRDHILYCEDLLEEWSSRIFLANPNAQLETP